MKKIFFILFLFFLVQQAQAQLPSQRPAGDMYPQYKKEHPQAPNTTAKLPSEAPPPKQAKEAATKAARVKKPAVETEADRKKKLPSNRKKVAPAFKRPKKI